MIETLAVLGFPLAGALLLAVIGARTPASRVNVAVSLLTWLASLALSIKVVRDGPLLVVNKLFFIDSFNVFLIALTAFVGFTTALFRGPTCKSRARTVG
jgi:hydrogenase-4 component F